MKPLMERGGRIETDSDNRVRTSATGVMKLPITLLAPSSDSIDSMNSYDEEEIFKPPRLYRQTLEAKKKVVAGAVHRGVTSVLVPTLYQFTYCKYSAVTVCD